MDNQLSVICLLNHNEGLLMILKQQRFDCDIEQDDIYGYHISKCCNTAGSNISCDDIVYWINHQKQQFGSNSEKIIERLMQELS